MTIIAVDQETLEHWANVVGGIIAYQRKTDPNLMETLRQMRRLAAEPPPASAALKDAFCAGYRFASQQPAPRRALPGLVDTAPDQAWDAYIQRPGSRQVA